MSSVNIVNFDQFHNSDLEHYAYNLIHFFLDKHGYTILNVEDKILENFNNSYYNIIYIYTHPLINDVNIDDLMEKVDLIKYNLKRQFFLFNQRILIITLNCSIDVEQIDLPKNVDIVNASDKSQLTKDNILTQYYPDIVDYPFDLDPAMLAYRINNLSMAYINQVSQAFNRKDKYVNIILSIIIIIITIIIIINIVINIIVVAGYIGSEGLGVISTRERGCRRYSFCGCSRYVIGVIVTIFIAAIFVFAFPRLTLVFPSQQIHKCAKWIYS